MTQTYFVCIQENGQRSPGCSSWAQEEIWGVSPVCPTCGRHLCMPVSVPDPGTTPIVVQAPLVEPPVNPLAKKRGRPTNASRLPDPHVEIPMKIDVPSPPESVKPLTVEVKEVIVTDLGMELSGFDDYTIEADLYPENVIPETTPESDEDSAGENG